MSGGGRKTGVLNLKLSCVSGVLKVAFLEARLEVILVFLRVW